MDEENSVEGIMGETEAMFKKWNQFFNGAAQDGEKLKNTASKLKELAKAAKSAEKETSKIAKLLSKLSGKWKF